MSAADEEGVVIITLRQVWEDGRANSDLLKDLNSKIDVFLAVQKGSTDKTDLAIGQIATDLKSFIAASSAALLKEETERKKADDDHETRLRAVERKVWAIPSAAAIISIAAIVVEYLARKR